METGYWLAAAACAAALVLFVLPELHVWFERRQAARDPWRQKAAGSEAVSVSALYVYPVKSCAGVAVASHAVDANGLAFDRRYMLVDRDGHFLTQRQKARMALVRPELPADVDAPLVLHAPDLPPLRVPVRRAADGGARKVVIWDDDAEGIDQVRASKLLLARTRAGAARVLRRPTPPPPCLILAPPPPWRRRRAGRRSGRVVRPRGRRGRRAARADGRGPCVRARCRRRRRRRRSPPRRRVRGRPTSRHTRAAGRQSVLQRGASQGGRSRFRTPRDECHTEGVMR